MFLSEECTPYHCEYWEMEYYIPQNVKRTLAKNVYAIGLKLTGQATRDNMYFKILLWS